MNKISVIIPMLNEAKTIGKVLQHVLRKSKPKNIAEIIIVDGGSTDGSLEFVTSLISNNSATTELFLLQSVKGRAKQMNMGSQRATGNILYFLHADSIPPNHFDQFIIDELQQGNSAGCFKMKFDHNHWWLRLASWLTQFRWRACRGGDQSQFIDKSLFEELNGFDEHYTIYEDNDLINKLYARNEFVVIQQWITTSARRYESQGIWKLQYHFCTIYVKKWFGASADELHRYYLKYIA